MVSGGGSMLDVENVIIRESDEEIARIAYGHTRVIYKQCIIESGQYLFEEIRFWVLTGHPGPSLLINDKVCAEIFTMGAVKLRVLGTP